MWDGRGGAGVPVRVWAGASEWMVWDGPRAAVGALSVARGRDRREGAGGGRGLRHCSLPIPRGWTPSVRRPAGPLSGHRLRGGYSL